MSKEICLTSSQMREIEAAAMRSGAVSGLDLMETAVQGVLGAILRHWPDLATTPRRALVLCGPGNNGGDGYGVACALRARGWSVTVHALAAPSTPDAQAMAARWAAQGTVGALEAAAEAVAQADLVVDAIFGSGLSRPFDRAGAVQLAVAEAHRHRAQTGTGPRVVAVDVPSGLCADSGRVLGAEGHAVPPDAIRADLTVTFETLFPGHLLSDGPALCGAVRCVPLGRAVAAALADRSDRLTCRRVLAPVPARLAKAAGAHKYRHGHALVLTGGAARTGAARLAARAALRVGAGLVTLGPPESALQEVAVHCTAAMVARVDDGAALRGLLEDERLNSLVLGPGLGLDARAQDLVAVALGAERPCVLDADALSLLAANPALAAQLHPACVLTPHDGEFARLVPDLARDFNAPAHQGPALSRLDLARQAAQRLGAVMVLKGPDTVIATPEGQAWIHGGAARAAPWLATAGSGDVLAGLIGGLLARGWTGPEAACAAVWLHAEAARVFGPGLIAEDLPEALPGVLRGLGL